MTTQGGPETLPRVAPRAVRTERDLRRLWKLDCEAYGEANVSYDRLHAWWTGYSSGLQIIRHAGEIAAAFGIWPLSETAYRLLSAGQVHEKLLQPIDFEPNSGLWYISGVVVAPRYRGRGLGLRMHRAAMTYARLKGLRRVCAVASSAAGASMLVRDKFAKLEPTMDGRPIYEFEDTSNRRVAAPVNQNAARPGAVSAATLCNAS